MSGYQSIVIVWVVVSLIAAALTGRRYRDYRGAPAVKKILGLTALHWLLSIVVFALTAFLMGDSLSMKTVVVVFIAATTLSLVVLAVQEPFSKPSIPDNDENM